MDKIGRLCRTERGDLIVVPFRLTSGAHYSCCIVKAPEDSRYPVGGYDISVPDDQLTPVGWTVDRLPEKGDELENQVGTWLVTNTTHHLDPMHGDRYVVEYTLTALAGRGG